MTTPRHPSTPPLEGDWVQRPLILFVEGQTVTGTARANWGAVHVTITSPIAGLFRERDYRGFAFAMLAHHRPEERFGLRGKLTDKGVERVKEMLADLYLDWRALSRHEAEVDAACRRARQELAAVERARAERARPHQEVCAALRRRFKAGELTQKEYQGKLKEVRRLLEPLAGEQWRAEQAVHLRFTTWLEEHCGRKVPLDEVERLLTDAVLIVPARPLRTTNNTKTLNHE